MADVASELDGLIADLKDAFRAYNASNAKQCVTALGNYDQKQEVAANSRVRDALIEALGKIQKQLAYDNDAHHKIYDDDIAVLNAVMNELVKLCPQKDRKKDTETEESVKAALVIGLKSDIPEVRKAAAQALGDIGSNLNDTCLEFSSGLSPVGEITANRKTKVSNAAILEKLNNAKNMEQDADTLRTMQNAINVLKGTQMDMTKESAAPSKKNRYLANRLVPQTKKNFEMAKKLPKETGKIRELA